MPGRQGSTDPGQRLTFLDNWQGGEVEALGQGVVVGCGKEVQIPFAFFALFEKHLVGSRFCEFCE
jgi:hypothetical protein